MTKWKTQRKLSKVKVILANLFQNAIHTNQAKKNLLSKQNCYLDLTVLVDQLTQETFYYFIISKLFIWILH